MCYFNYCQMTFYRMGLIIAKRNNSRTYKNHKYISIYVLIFNSQISRCSFYFLKHYVIRSNAMYLAIDIIAINSRLLLYNDCWHYADRYRSIIGHLESIYIRRADEAAGRKRDGRDKILYYPGCFLARVTVIFEISKRVPSLSVRDFRHSALLSRLC